MNQKTELKKYGIVLQDLTTEERIKQHIAQMEMDHLSSFEQLKLIEEYQTTKSEEALAKLILTNIGLIHSFIKKHVNVKKLQSTTYDDLVMEGIEGMIEAARRFDASRNITFSSYATLWIQQRIFLNVQSFDSIIHIPIHIRKQYAKYQKFVTSELQKTGVKPPDAEIMEQVGIDANTLQIIKNWNRYYPISLATPISSAREKEENNKELETIIADQDNHFKTLTAEIDQKILLYVLKKVLQPIGYYTIYYRFFAPDERTLNEIGKSLGVSRERIRQVEQKSMTKIRTLNTKTPYSFDQMIRSVINSQEEQDKMLRFREVPKSPDEIAYIYRLKFYLEEEDYFILYSLALSDVPYKMDELAREMHMSPQVLEEKYLKIKEKIETLKEEELPTLQTKKEKPLSTTKILNLDLLPTYRINDKDAIYPGGSKKKITKRKK